MAEIQVSFPVFLIANRDGIPVVSEFQGKECFLLYAFKEHVEVYLQMAGPEYSYVKVNDEGFLGVLAAENPEVPYFAWHPSTMRPKEFIMLLASEFRGKTSEPHGQELRGPDEGDGK